LPNLTEATSSHPCETNKDKWQPLRRRGQDHRCALRTQRVIIAEDCGIGAMPNSSRRDTVRSNGGHPFESSKLESQLWLVLTTRPLVIATWPCHSAQIRAKS
jgi:hypothetical protein